MVGVEKRQRNDEHSAVALDKNQSRNTHARRGDENTNSPAVAHAVSTQRVDSRDGYPSRVVGRRVSHDITKGD